MICVISFFWGEIDQIKHLKRLTVKQLLSQGLSITVSITAQHSCGQIDQHCHHLSKVYPLNRLRAYLAQNLF